MGCHLLQNRFLPRLCPSGEARPSSFLSHLLISGFEKGENTLWSTRNFPARLAISPQSNPALILSSLAISGFSLNHSISLSSLSSTGFLSSASPVRSQSTLTLNFSVTLNTCQKSIRRNVLPTFSFSTFDT